MMQVVLEHFARDSANAAPEHLFGFIWIYMDLLRTLLKLYHTLSQTFLDLQVPWQSPCLLPWQKVALQGAGGDDGVELGLIWQFFLGGCWLRLFFTRAQL